MRLGMFRGIRGVIIAARMLLYRRVFKADLDETVRMSLSAKLDLTFPRGIHIGPKTYLAFGARVLSHDMTRGLYLHTRIGERCFIGGHSLILPGVTIGDGCVVGAGSVVTRDVPAGSIVAGNPAKVIDSGIAVGDYGRFDYADDNEARLRTTDADLAAMSAKTFDQRKAREAREQRPPRSA